MLTGYQPLTDDLATVEGRSIARTFAAVEAILDAELSLSATTGGRHWYGTANHHARASRAGGRSAHPEG